VSARTIFGQAGYGFNVVPACAVFGQAGYGAWDAPYACSIQSSLIPVPKVRRTHPTLATRMLYKQG
jgi:hypothetical protein